MELKYFRKPWLQAFKGAYFVLLGIIVMMQIPSTLYSISIFFSFFIGLTGFVLVLAPLILKVKDNRKWNLTLGIINLAFAVLIIMKMNQPRTEIYLVIVFWIILNSVTEVVEAVLLFLQKNAYFALFIINALLSSLMGLGFYNLLYETDSRRLFNMGFIALVVGLVYELSAFLLKATKKPE